MNPTVCILFSLASFTQLNVFEIRLCYVHPQVILFRLLSNILLYGYNAICLFIHLWLMLVCSRLLVTELIWTFVYKLWYGNMFIFLLGKYLEGEVINHTVCVFKLISISQYILQSSCTIYILIGDSHCTTSTQTLGFLCLFILAIVVVVPLNSY